MTSLSTTFWQLLLAQGLCTGLGNGLMFTPSLAVVSTYFKRRRALAFGITATGSATGGLIFPSMARQLLGRIGFSWTVRAMGLVQLVTLIAANLLLRPRIPPRKSGPWVDIASFKEKGYLFFAIGIFFVSSISWVLGRHLLTKSDILGHILSVLLPCIFCGFAIRQTLGILRCTEPSARRQRRRHYWTLASERRGASFRKHNVSYSCHICLGNLPLLMARCVHGGRTVCLG